MSQKFKTIIIFIIILLSIAGWFKFGQAAITKQINYQGKLTNASDGEVSNGNYDMKFVIYNAASGGQCLWTSRGACSSPTARSVSVASNLFSIMLGDTSAGDNVLNLDFATTTASYYLAVTVGSDSEMTPRKLIGSVPMAYNANNLIGDGTINLTSSSTEPIAQIAASSTDTLFKLNQKGAGSVIKVVSAPIASSTIASLQLTDNPLSSGSVSGAFIGANPASFGGNFLDFQVGGSRKFIVDSSGNATTSGTQIISTALGVATTTLPYTFNVLGKGYITSDLIVGGDITVQGGATYSGSGSFPRATTTDYLYAANYIKIATTTSPYAFNVSGSGYFTSNLIIGGNFITSGNATTSGRLVIGTTQPTNDYGKIWIGGDVYNSGNATTTGTLQVVSALATGAAQPNSTTTANFGGNVYVQGNATTTGNFAVSSTTQADNPTLFVNSQTGNVGIGTANPQELLHIRQSSSGLWQARLRIQQPAGGHTANIGYNSASVFEFTGTHYGGYGPVKFDFGSTNYTFIGGNVGIGLTNPTSTLSVLGSADIRGNATTSGNLIVGASSWQAPTSTLTVNGSLYATGNATTSGAFSAGGVFYVKQDTGYVGIGTTRPGVKLEVSDLSSTRIRVTNTGGAIAEVIGGGSAAWFQSYSNHPVYFATNDANAQMMLNTNGNVGIGTTAPGAMLHASTTDESTIGLRLTHSGTAPTANFLELQSQAGTFLSGFTASGGLLINIASSTALVIQDGSGNTKFVVDSNTGNATTSGNLIVGASSWAAPTSTLTVSGSLYATGNATTSGSFSAGGLLYVKQDTGYVGIGTTGPIYPLTVKGSSDANVFGMHDGTRGVMLQTISSPSNAGIIGYYNGNYNALDIRAKSGVGSQLYLTTSGNVGIGTTAPGAMLHASTTDESTIGLRITHSGTAPTANFLELQSQAGTFLSGFTASGGLLMNIASSTALVIQDGSGNTKFVVDSNTGNATTSGNLIVGASSWAAPTSTLTINGSLYATGNATTSGAFSAGGVFYVNQDTGYVGIGTTSPRDRVQIAGTRIGHPGNFLFGDEGNFTPGLRMYKWQGGGDSYHVWRTKINETGYYNIGYESTANGVGGSETFDEILTIKSNGNVGIGLTNPTSTLSVLGSANIWGNATTSGNLIVGASSWAAPTSTLTINGSLYATGNATTSGRLVIGTTQPTNDYGKIWIGGDVYNSGNSTTTGTLQVVSSLATGTAQPNSTTTANFGGNVYVQGNATTTRNFAVSSTTQADNPTLFVDSQTGNVGIGTAAPGTKLQVYGTSGDTRSIIQSTAGSSRLRLTSISGQLIDFFNSDSHRGQLGFYGGGTTFAIRTGSGDINPPTTNPHFVIDSSGLVGIGTTNPLATLNVSGTTLLGGNASTTGTLVVNATANNSTWNSATNTLTVVGSGLFTGNLITSGNATTSGRLVIGTTQPTNDYGKIWIGGDVYNSGNATTTGTLQVVSALATGAAQPNSTTTANFGGNVYVQGNATTTGNFAVSSTTQADNPTLFVDSQTGNVGIGTAAPTKPLYVNSGIDVVLRLNYTGSGDYKHAYRALAPNFGTGQHFVFAEGGVAENTKNTAHIDFYYASFGSNSNRLSMGLWGVDDVLNILGNGNVGIGTTNPLAILNVNGTTLLGGNASTTGNLVVNATANSSTWNSATNTLTVVGSGLFTGNLITSGNATTSGNLTLNQANPFFQWAPSAAGDKLSFQSGTTTLMSLDIGGTLTSKGPMVQNGAPDYAEFILSYEDLEDGDLVAVADKKILKQVQDDTEDGVEDDTEVQPPSESDVEAQEFPESEPIIEKARKEKNEVLAGIITSNSSSQAAGYLKERYPDNAYLMTLSGRVKAKVSSENGPIRRGDYLTFSSLEGVAAKAVDAGPIIGTALEDFSGNDDKEKKEVQPPSEVEPLKTGKVLVLVHLGHYSPPEELKNIPLSDFEKTLKELDSEKVKAGIFAAVLEKLENFGIWIQNGIVKIKELTVDKFFAKKARLEKLEMVDQFSGELYCTWIENGEWVKVKGECEMITSNSTQKYQTPQLPAIEPSPVLEPQQEPQSRQESQSQPQPEPEAESPSAPQP